MRTALRKHAKDVNGAPIRGLGFGAAPEATQARSNVGQRHCKRETLVAWKKVIWVLDLNEVICAASTLAKKQTHRAAAQ